MRNTSMPLKNNSFQIFPIPREGKQHLFIEYDVLSWCFGSDTKIILLFFVIVGEHHFRLCTMHSHWNDGLNLCAWNDENESYVTHFNGNTFSHKRLLLPSLAFIPDGWRVLGTFTHDNHNLSNVKLKNLSCAHGTFKL